MIKRYIVPIDDMALNFDEMFVGEIRNQKQVVLCKDCANYRHWECPVEQAGYRPKEDMYCAWGESDANNI